MAIYLTKNDNFNRDNIIYIDMFDDAPYDVMLLDAFRQGAAVAAVAYADNRYSLDDVVSELAGFLATHEMDIYLILPDLLQVSNDRSDSIEKYIDKNYIEDSSLSEMVNSESDCCIFLGKKSSKRVEEPALVTACGAAYDEISFIDEEKSFMETLFEHIDAKGLTDPECYKRSNIDRKLFSKIRNNPAYTPKKNTILALCLGLRLNLAESEDLLSRAGYALSPCSRFDLAVKYFLTSGNYESIHDVNIALFEMFEETVN